MEGPEVATAGQEPHASIAANVLAVLALEALVPVAGLLGAPISSRQSSS